MQRFNINWTAKALSNQMEKGKVNYDNAVQRSLVWDEALWIVYIDNTRNPIRNSEYFVAYFQHIINFMVINAYEYYTILTKQVSGQKKTRIYH